MTDTLDVDVLARVGTTVSLLVEARIEDDWSGIPADEGFALMLLHEATYRMEEYGGRDATGCPLDVAVSGDDLVDEDWLRKYARGFIASVRVTHQKGKRRPKARLHIEVTHPAWIEHLDKGASWSSTAFEAADEFDECPPIAPEPAPEPIDDPDAFIYLPREACHWGDEMPEYAPAWLEFPAYASSAYTTGEVITDPAAVPADWIGRAVRAVGPYGGNPEDGALASTTELVHISSGGSGYSPEIRSVARLVPKRGRRGSRLKYADALRNVEAQHVGTRHDGRQVEISFRIPPDRRELAVQDAADLIPLLDSRWAELLEGGPRSRRRAPVDPTELARALATDMETLSINNTDKLLERVASKYIAGHTITYPPRRDIDSIPPAEAHAILTAPWPIARVLITVTDERWIPPATNPPPDPVHLWAPHDFDPST